jgi:hypothetical protein
MTALRGALRRGRRDHLDAGHHHGGPAFERRASEAQFEAAWFAVVDGCQLDFESRGSGFAFEVPAQVFGDQLGVFGPHQVGEPPAKELARVRRAAQFGESRIGEFDAVALDQHRLVHRLEQATIQVFAFLACGTLCLQPLDQAIDALRDVTGAALARIRRETLGQVAAAGDRLYTLTQFAQPLDLARALQQGHGQRSRDGTQQDQRDRNGGHAQDWPCPLGRLVPASP